MQQLREGCSAAGLEAVRTYIATGNILFRSAADAMALQGTLADVLRHHGLDNAVFLRRPDELGTAISGNPFADATRERPNLVLAVFLNEPPLPDGLAALRPHAGPERIAAVGRELFIDYVDGVGQSKLTPALIERRLGQPGTARNMNTVKALYELSRKA